MGSSNGKKDSEPGCTGYIVGFGILFVILALACGLGTIIGGGEFSEGFSSETKGWSGLIIFLAIIIIIIYWIFKSIFGKK